MLRKKRYNRLKRVRRYKPIPPKPKGVSAPQITAKRKEMLNKDREFYRAIFNSLPHKCQECGIGLPDEFETSDGIIIGIWQYSHILPKSTHPEFRHDIRNMNRLCMYHHAKWENGDKKSMRIWYENKKVINKLLTELHK